MDAYKNFALARIAVAPSPADSGTSMTFAAGHGAYLPVVPFNATVWDGLLPPAEFGNSIPEIVRVMDLTGDVATILRQQEGSRARAILVGDFLAATFTEKFVADLLTEIAQAQVPELPYVDLVEGAYANPAADNARLYALDVNGYTQVEMKDSVGHGVRFSSDNVIIAKIKETNGIARGQAVYISGASGANAEIRLAKADDIATMPVIGLVLDAGANNAFTRVLNVGTLQGVNTSGFVEGVSLFTSPTVAGGFTDVLPTAPAFAQRVGFVTRSHAVQGEVLVLTTGVLADPRFHHATHETGGTDALAALDASILTSGTLPDARLSANVQMKPVAQALTQTIYTQVEEPSLVNSRQLTGGVYISLDSASVAGQTSVQLGPHAVSHMNGMPDQLLLTALPGFLDVPGESYLRGDREWAAPVVPQSNVTGLTAALATKAPLASPALTGTPTAPTAVALTSTTQLATTKFVTDAVALVPAGPAGPQGDPGPAGGILFDQWVWISAATSATVGAGRAAVNHDTPSLATQMWVHKLASGSAGVDWTTVISTMVVGDKTYFQRKGDASVYNRYTLTGVPTLVGGTTWVLPIVWTSGNGEPPNGVDVIVAFQRLTDFPDHHTTHDTDGSDALTALSASILTTGTLPDARLSANIARLASPAFTGVPTAPTASVGTNTTQLATTEFVLANAASVGANVAYKNIDNAFVPQTFAGGSVVTGVNSAFYFRDTTGAANSTVFQMVQSSGFFHMRALDDALSVQSTALILSRDGSVRIGGGSNSSLYITDSSQAVNSRVWRIMNQSAFLRFYKQDDVESGFLNVMSLERSGVTLVRALQIGETNAYGAATNALLRLGVGQTEAGPAVECVRGDSGAWASVTAHYFYSVASGNSLADLTVRGATNFVGGVNLGPSGNLTGGGASILNGVTYPGRIDTGVWQTSWYLASHPSYGLYSNTGLFLAGPVAASQVNVAGATVGVSAGGIQCTHIEAAPYHIRAGTGVYAGTGFYELGRSYPLGTPIDFTPTLSSSNGTATLYSISTCQYTLIGKMIIISLMIRVMVTDAAIAEIYMVVPGGYVSSKYAWTIGYLQPRSTGDVNGGPTLVLAVPPGSTQIRMFMPSLEYFALGAPLGHLIAATLVFSIQ